MSKSPGYYSSSSGLGVGSSDYEILNWGYISNIGSDSNGLNNVFYGKLCLVIYISFESPYKLYL